MPPSQQATTNEASFILSQSSAGLEEISDYIARDNPKRAFSFILEIEAHCREIAKLPEVFIFREELAPLLQMAIHGNYLILFRVQDESVRIERIVHGARKLSELI
jgi:toxin ParE1/3/4